MKRLDGMQTFVVNIEDSVRVGYISRGRWGCCGVRSSRAPCVWRGMSVYSYGDVELH